MSKYYKNMLGVAATAVMAVTMVAGGVQAQTVDALKVGEAAYTQGIPQYDVPITFDKPEYTVRKGTGDVVHNLRDILGMKAQVQTPEGLRWFEYYVNYDVNSIDIHKVGDYPVIFTLNRTDDDGRARFVGRGEAIIHVIDSKEPVLSFKNGSEIIAHVGDKINPADYVTAIDAEDGDITGLVKVFDLKTGKMLKELKNEGKYRLQFAVNDSDGNTVDVEGTLTVLPKKQAEDQAPVLNIPGETTIIAGTEFKAMNGVSANDKEDGDITSKVTYSGNVDVNTPGVYEVTYKVLDSKGHEVTAKRKVTVKGKEEGNNSVFTDVPKNHWSENAINYLAENGLVKGYGDGRFGFGDNVTRGQVASLISRHLNLGDVQGSSIFTDTKGDMFEKDIEKVSRMGIMVGDGTGKFRSKDSLTRYEMAAVLTNAFNLDMKGNENFVDVPKGHWAYDYTRILYGNKISAGTGNGEFAGDAVVKREQYMQFLYNETIKKA
ncbi:S-layer protein sap precursor [Bacillus mobilis]|uniref:S-layer protein sap n=1 Tax=Bacillus mobilis TaxID=2026190 RepID=A0A1Y6A2N0_9BACI|nr:S-layer homology domain-containing protein [Bacillus mobilis]SME19527.1 S-layer protein sap precursor [Bacillus mobilis]